MHMDHASVALLMLDIASAKSTLTQLQQTFTAADAEHQRTKGKLQQLHDQKQDAHPLYAQLGGKGSTAVADKATAQQLQALHTENLQLKCLLKQEIEARQQLESQHAALLELLRSHGLQDILAADQLDAVSISLLQNTQRQHTFAPLLAGTAGTQQTGAQAPSVGTAAAPAAPVSRSKVPDQQSFRSSANSIPAEASIPAARMPTGADPAEAGYSSSSFMADATVAGADVNAACYRRSRADNVSPSSAYFPQQQCDQQQQQQQQQERMLRQGSTARPSIQHEHAADAQGRACQPAAESTWHGADNSRSVKGSSIPRKLFAQHDQHHAQQQQHQHPQQTKQPRHCAPQLAGSSWEQLGTFAATATYAAADGRSSSSGSSNSSYSSSCSHSQASEQLLDSDDLEELATLCDGLINQTHGMDVLEQQQQQHTQQPMNHAGAALAAAVAASAAAIGTACRSHTRGLDGSSLCTDQPAVHEQQHLECTHSQRMQLEDMPWPHPQPAAMPPVNLTDVEQLALRLQQLQQQVAAAGVAESGLMQHSSAVSSSVESAVPAPAAPAGAAAAAAAPAAAAAAASAQQQQNFKPGPQVARQTSNNSGLSSMASSSSGARSRSASSNGANLQQQQQQQLGGESSGVADLQQQLAQRMQEVKQRLRNICSGMLEEALTSSAGEKARGNASAHTAAHQPTSASSQGLEAWQSQPVQQQQHCAPAAAAAGASGPAAAAAAAGAQASTTWGSSRHSSSIGSGSSSGGSPTWLEGQQQQPTGRDKETCAQANAGAAGVGRPVAFTVHAHAAPAPSAGVGAAGPTACGPAGSSAPRRRVVHSFWPPAAAQQAAGASAGAAAAVAAESAGVGMHVSGGGVTAAHAAAAGAAAGQDAACSDSSWSTLNDEEEHAGSQQQQQQQQPAGSSMLGDDAVTPPSASSKSRGTSCSGGGVGGSNTSAASSPSTSPSLPQHQDHKQHHSGPWRPQRHADMSHSLEGVLFGMGGRVSGEVSQTFSPLKTAPAGQSFWSPGSPLTPMK